MYFGSLYFGTEDKTHYFGEYYFGAGVIAAPSQMMIDGGGGGFGEISRDPLLYDETDRRITRIKAVARDDNEFFELLSMIMRTLN